MHEKWKALALRSRAEAEAAGVTVTTDFDRASFEGATADIYAKAMRDPATADLIERIRQTGKPVVVMVRQDEAVERTGSLLARARSQVVGLVRAVPIRWRILSIAALNSAVVVVLAVMIWDGGMQVPGLGLERCPADQGVRSHPGAARKPDQPAAEPDPPLHQPAESGILRRDIAVARGHSRHAEHARLDRSDAVGISRGARARHRPLPQRLRRASRATNQDHEDL